MKTFMIKFKDNSETNIDADYYYLEGDKQKHIAVFIKIIQQGRWINETEIVARICTWKLIKS